MSLSAVSVEHFAIFAHLPVESLPKNPSNCRLINFLCLSLNEIFRLRSQNSALRSTDDKVFSAEFNACSKQCKNHKIHSVISPSPCCVRSSTSDRKSVV